MSLSPDERPPIRPFRSRLGAVAISLGLVVGFVAVRGMIYALISANNELEWNLRDSVMDIPRALFGFFAWRYGRRLWSNEQLGHHWRRTRECFLLGFLFCLPVLARPFFFPVAPLSWSWFPVLAFSSFVVGYFEELLFRSVLLRALYDQYGERAALWGSSLAFMLFHVQAQPVQQWPGIFVIGFCFAFMRLRGVSLWGLALVHSAFDTLILGLEPQTDFPPFWLACTVLVHLYLTAMYVMAYRIKLLVSDTFW